MKRKLVIAALLAGLSVSLSACVGFGGKTQTTVKATTVGQELADLDAAYKAGLLTEEEYKKKRTEILKSK